MGSRTVEERCIAAVQQRLAARPVIRIARTVSGFGEHSAGWLVLGVVGAVVDRRRSRTWSALAAGAFLAHALAVVVKRIVRRPRPAADVVRVLTPTPSRLSFPSAHAASTTAAAVVLADVCLPAAVLIPPVMGLSRVLLGVHYPSDVAAGAAIGLVVGGVASRAARGSRSQR